MIKGWLVIKKGHFYSSAVGGSSRMGNGWVQLVLFFWGGCGVGGECVSESGSREWDAGGRKMDSVPTWEWQGTTCLPRKFLGRVQRSAPYLQQLAAKGGL